MCEQVYLFCFRHAFHVSHGETRDCKRSIRRAQREHTQRDPNLGTTNCCEVYISYLGRNVSLFICLKGVNFTSVPQTFVHSHPFTILDKDQRVIALFAGRPNDPTWDSVTAEASRAMEEAAQAATFKDQQYDHRRGLFPTLAYGFSFGGGRKVR